MQEPQSRRLKARAMIPLQELSVVKNLHLLGIASTTVSRVPLIYPIFFFFTLLRYCSLPLMNFCLSLPGFSFTFLEFSSKLIIIRFSSLFSLRTSSILQVTIKNFFLFRFHLKCRMKSSNNEYISITNCC